MKLSFFLFSIVPNLNSSSSKASTQSIHALIIGVLAILIPIIILLSIALHKKHRIRVLRQRIEDLEKLYRKKSTK